MQLSPPFPIKHVDDADEVTAHAADAGRRSLLRVTFATGCALMLAGGMAGCASRGRRGGATASRGRRGGGPREAPRDVAGRVDDMAASEVALAAVSLVDTPYRYGGNTPESGFDCSGLIVYVYRQRAGWALPRTVAQLARTGQPVHFDSVRAGDLVVFDTSGPDTHAGIYVGGGRFVHAPSRGGVVRIEPLDGPYWWPRFTAVRRI